MPGTVLGTFYVTHLLVPTQREMCYYCSHLQMEKAKLGQMELAKGSHPGNGRTRIGIAAGAPVHVPEYSTTWFVSCSELAEESSSSPSPCLSQAVCLTLKSLGNSLFWGFALEQTRSPRFPLCAYGFLTHRTMASGERWEKSTGDPRSQGQKPVLFFSRLLIN